MPCRAYFVLFTLIMFPIWSGAGSPPAQEEVAGNEQVKKLIATFGGRGMLADDTPSQTPAEALKLFKLRSDLAIDLIAHEPEVTQPLYLSFDSRGRLWVTQYRQYQFPAGLKIVSYDQHLRAKFDTVPPPPPHGPKGADLITVHEDTNGDGVYDHSKVVIEGLNIATAAITGAGGIWVLNPPYLLFYPDANQDDVPDSEPKVELSGFGLEDTHSVATSLQWGPDGWLYGATGSTTTGNVSSASTKHVTWEGQHLWRFHPTRKTFQIYAEGGGNTMSLDIDSKGRVFSGTNTGSTRGMHFELGSYGVKNWGKHGPPMNPYAFDFFDHMPHQGDDRRFPQAFTIYEGGLLGPRYEGRIIAPNALHNLVYVSDLIPQGSTFRTLDQDPLLSSTDRWFRPVCTLVGPDGCLYLSDWYDTRLSHVRPIDDWSKKDGRIYRIRPAAGAPVLKPFDLHQAPPAELCGYLKHPNEWFRKQAQLEIGWRDLKELAPELKEMALDQKASHALDALFALQQLNALDDATVSQLLHHADPYVRRWAVRSVEPSMAAALLELPKLAAQETHPEVRTMLAAAAKRLPGSIALPIFKALLSTTDARLQTMLWWLLEAKCETDRELVLGVFADRTVWSQPVCQTKLITYLAKRWAMVGGELNFQSCAKLLDLAPDPKAQGLVIRGLAAAFAGGELPTLPAALRKALMEHLQTQTGGDLTLALRTGDPAATQQAFRLLQDAQAPVVQRAALALTLAELGNKAVLDAMAPIFKASGQETLKRALLPAVAKFDDPMLIQLMVDGWEGRMAAERNLREAALRLISGRKAWAKLLLAKVDTWQIPAHHFTPDIVRQLALHQDPEITAAVDRHWKGLLAVAPTEEIQQETLRLKKVLLAARGDHARGKPIFTQRCALCHRLFNEGQLIGPDLTGYERTNLDFWLSNILTPSLEIREGFGAYVLELNSGQILTGMITAQDAKSLSVKDLANQITKINLTDLKKQTASPVSLMPPMLLQGMSDADLQDLFAYLTKE